MNVSDVAPKRVSLLDDIHELGGAQYRQWQNQSVVDYYAGSKDVELEHCRRLALCDLSTLDRVGFKGSGTSDWLRKNEVLFADVPNQAVHDVRNGVVARLSNEEQLILRSPFSEHDAGPVFGASIEGDRRVYELPRQASHAWLFLCGEEAALMMSYLCAIDLRREKFANYQVAQTSIAKLNGIAIRDDVNGVHGFHLLCDQPSVAYWWEVLLDAMSVFDGAPVGIDALLRLNS